MADEAQPLLLEGALVVALDEAGTLAERTVRVEGGRIAAVTEPSAPAPPGARRVDCRGRLLLPGLVNAHLHPELHVTRGLLQGRTLREWGDCQPLTRALAFLSGPAGREARRAATRASLAECLLGGVTAVGVYGITDGAPPDQAAELRALGLRGHVTIRDMAFAPSRGLAVPHVYRLHAEETLTEAELDAAAAAHERGERIVMHVAETRWRVELCRARFGTTPIRLLERWGLLSPRVLLSHAVHVDEAEIDLIARAGAPVLASPSAEMKLGDGIAPVPALLEAGALVALGTDAAVCNDATDVFLEMRQLGLLHALHSGPAALSPERILRAATRGGAAALGLAEGAGSIAAGAPADLVLVDAESPRLQPLVVRDDFDTVYGNLVFAATAADVTDVMVAGTWRVCERRLVDLDAAEIWRELAAAGRALHDTLEDG